MFSLNFISVCLEVSFLTFANLPNSHFSLCCFGPVCFSAECTAPRGKPRGLLAIKVWCASSSVLLSLTFCMDALAPSGFSSSWTHSAAHIFVCLDICLLVMSPYMLFVCFCIVHAWHNTVCAWVSVHGCVCYTTHLWLCWGPICVFPPLSTVRNTGWALGRKKSF